MTKPQGYQYNIALLTRFLADSEEGGFMFAVVRHQGIIPDINTTLIRNCEASSKKAKGFRARPGLDIPIIEQIKQAANDADALIFINIDELIVLHPEADILTKLNFAREKLYQLRTPILFWVSEKNLIQVINQSADLYTQRALSNVYFDEIPETEAAEDLAQYYSEHYRDSAAYEKIKLRINLLAGQLEEAEQNGYPPKRITNDIAAPLMDAYADVKIYPPAFELLKKYKTHFNDSLNSLLTLGRVYRHSNKYQKAFLSYQKAADTYGDAMAYCAMANMLKLQKKHGKAQTVYEKIIELFPNNVVARSGLAEVLKKQGDLTQAQTIYEKTVELFPNDIYARNGFAEVLKKQGDLTQAQTIYEKTVELFPNDAVARTGLAEVLKKQGDLTQAQTVYEKTVKLFPNDIVARTGLAYLLMTLKKYDEALQLFETVLILNERNTYAQQGKTKVLHLLQEQEKTL